MKKYTNLNPAFFTPSGYNDKFYGEDLSFAEYIQQTQKMIAKARADLTPENRDMILAANSPYEFFPSTPETGVKKKYKRAMLMVHGLSDAPFSLMEMGKIFAQNGFFVRGVLLPGHGTVPADLLHVRYEEWVRCVEYGIASLKEIAEEVFITGFSLGGTLAIRHALKNKDLSGLILLAPAFQFATLRVPFYTHYFRYLQYIFPRFKWFFKQPQTDYAKYQTFTVNASIQTMHLMKEAREAIQKNSCQLPIFIAASADDELISPKATFDLFNKNQYPKKQILIYGDRLKYLEKFEGVEVKNSAVPQQHIINFSHACLSVSPHNPQYGIDTDYHDFSHYFGEMPSSEKKIFLGSPTFQTLKKYAIQRLRYNPDFDGMMERILNFFMV
jgi:esterase/lipase